MKTTSRKIKAGKGIIAALMCSVMMFGSGCGSTEYSVGAAQGSSSTVPVEQAESIVDIVIRNGYEEAEKDFGRFTERRKKNLPHEIWSAWGSPSLRNVVIATFPVGSSNESFWHALCARRKNFCFLTSRRRDSIRK